MAVGIGNLAVVVVVDELQVACLCVGLNTIAVLVYISCSFSVALEDATILYEIERTERLTLCILIAVRQIAERTVASPYTGFTVGITHTDIANPVLEPSEVATNVVRPILVYAVVPVERKLYTTVAYLALIDEHRVETDRARPVHRLGLDEVEGALLEPVELHSQAVVEHIEINAEVELLRCLPSKLVVESDRVVDECVPQQVLLNAILCLLLP